MNMEIGTKTPYTRFADGKIIIGEGTIKGIGLDPDNRVVVLVRDGEHRFAIHKVALRNDPEFVKKFTVMSEKVMELGTEGNKKQDETGILYNGKINAVKDELLGAAFPKDMAEPILQNNAMTKDEATHNMD